MSLLQVGLLLMIVSIAIAGTILGIRLSVSKHGMSYPALSMILPYHFGALLLEPQIIDSSFTAERYAIASIFFGLLALLIVTIVCAYLSEKFEWISYRVRGQHPRIFGL